MTIKTEPWKVIKSENVLDTPWISVRKDKCELPDGTVVPDYYVLQGSDSAIITAVTEEGKVILVKQYKHGFGKVVTELPAGIIDQGETPAECIKRELLEETGYDVKSVTQIAELSFSPSGSSFKKFVFIAKGAKKIQGPQINPKEVIETILKSPKQVNEMISNSEIIAMATVAGFYLAVQHLGKK